MSDKIKEVKYRFEDTKIRVRLKRTRSNSLVLKVEALGDVKARSKAYFSIDDEPMPRFKIRDQIKEVFEDVENVVAEESNLERSVVDALEEVLEDKDTSRPWSL